VYWEPRFPCTVPSNARTGRWIADSSNIENSGRLSGSRKRKQALLESNLPGILDPTHPTDVSSEKKEKKKEKKKGQEAVKNSFELGEAIWSPWAAV
jgi:hypothetical protein